MVEHGLCSPLLSDPPLRLSHHSARALLHQTATISHAAAVNLWSPSEESQRAASSLDLMLTALHPALRTATSKQQVLYEASKPAASLLFSRADATRWVPSCPCLPSPPRFLDSPC